MSTLKKLKEDLVDGVMPAMKIDKPKDKKATDVAGPSQSKDNLNDTSGGFNVAGSRI